MQNQYDNLMQEQNYRSIDDFEGYSPMEMHSLLYDAFGEDSPIQLQKLNADDYAEIPILNLVRYITDLIAEAGELKLTNRGFLPTRVVAEVYHQGFLREGFVEYRRRKALREIDVKSVHLGRILGEISGIVKKRYNKLSMTKKGEKITADNFSLLEHLFKVYCTKFNWAYLDGFGDDRIGQVGFGFSLVLLSKYGDKKRIDTFYSEKYFKAFPKLIMYIREPRYETIERHVSRCYSLRTFDRFMYYFGLIKIEQEKVFDSDKLIEKTKIFDRLITCRPHFPWSYAMRGDVLN